MKWKNLLPFRELSQLLRDTSPTSRLGANRREFTRVPLSLEADILAGDTPILSGRTEDLSMKGLSLVCDTLLPVGTVCRIVLQLSGREAAASLTPLMLTIQLEGKVVRVTERGFAIEFREIIGQESFEYLQHLLVYHSRATSSSEHVQHELQQASWVQTTQIIHPFADRSPLFATRFALKRDQKQAETEIELSPGCIVLLTDSFRKTPRPD
ncbi:MAG: PilZ domain-containing protein [Candidatus Binatia bacterium]|nr:PilZ domain-containing protein [Candidatus Binatia bacterium]